MKARLPGGKDKYTIAQREERARKETSDFLMLGFTAMMADKNGYATKRLDGLLLQMGEFFDYLGGYGDAAKYKCYQILKSKGFDWERRIQGKAFSFTDFQQVEEIDGITYAYTKCDVCGKVHGNNSGFRVTVDLASNNTKIESDQMALCPKCAKKILPYIKDGVRRAMEEGVAECLSTEK